MQTKNVNLLQSNSETTCISAAAPPQPATNSSTSTVAPTATGSASAPLSSPTSSVNQAPPLPPRTLLQCHRPPSNTTASAPSHYASTNLAQTQDSSYLSPYKPVPLPKPVPPPYRQPPHPVSSSGPADVNLSHGRMNNIETAAILMPGSMMPDSNSTYITHSTKFPIKREHDIYGQSQMAKGDEDEFRIPKLSEVRRMQRQKSANAITPEPFPQVRTQQAWTSDSKAKPNGVQEGIQQRLRSLLSQSSETCAQPSMVKNQNLGQHQSSNVDEGEPLLMRSCSGPVYPLGIDNQGVETHDAGYLPAHLHQRLDGQGQRVFQHRLDVSAHSRENGRLYRAQCVPTNGPPEQPSVAVPPRLMESGDAEWMATNGTAAQPNAPAALTYTLRDACSRMYHRPGTKATIHQSMQSLKGSMSSLHSMDRKEGNENPYDTRADVLGSARQRRPLALSTCPNSTPQVDAEGCVTPEGRRSELAPGVDLADSVNLSRMHDSDTTVVSGHDPRGYYHLKDMISGSGGQQERGDGNQPSVGPTGEPIYGQSRLTGGTAPVEKEKVYGVIGKFGATCEDPKGNNIYGPLRSQVQQQQQRNNRPLNSSTVVPLEDASGDARLQGENSSKGAPSSEGQRKEAQIRPPETTSNPLRGVPLSPSSTSSESGHGTMQTGAPSTKSGSLSGGTLNTSSESDVLLGNGGGSGLPVSTTNGARNEVAIVAAKEARLEMAKGSGPVADMGNPASSTPAPSARHLWTNSMEHELQQILDSTQDTHSRGTASDGGEEDHRTKGKFPEFVANREKLRETFNLHESTFSDSFSVTPPLPPLSPPNTPPRSPKAGRLQSKYKLSLSAGNLHKNSGMTPDILETTREGSMQNLKDGNGRLQSRKGAMRNKAGGFGPESRPWTARGKHGGGGSAVGKYGPNHCRISVQSKGSTTAYNHRMKGSQISLGVSMGLDSHDGEMTSTTTGLDMESLLDDAELSTDDASSQTSQLEGSEINTIRRQLEGLEAMYAEVMRMLGVKGATPLRGQLAGQRSLHDLRPSRRKVFGSLSSLSGKGFTAPSTGRTNASKDRTGHNDRKKGRESKGVSRRFQRLESHVVTLARSVAHLSSEMRTQHIMFQELENLRQEVAQLHDQQVAMRSSGRPGYCGVGAAGRGVGGSAAAMVGREWDNFRCSIPSLTNPARVKKLTKFFGDEPPLLRLFLKKLGYEKYASQFETEKIGIIELPYLTEERLQKIGIPMGPRMRILQEAQMSFRQEHFNIYIV